MPHRSAVFMTIPPDQQPSTAEIQGYRTEAAGQEKSPDGCYVAAETVPQREHRRDVCAADASTQVKRAPRQYCSAAWRRGVRREIATGGGSAEFKRAAREGITWLRLASESLGCQCAFSRAGSDPQRKHDAEDWDFSSASWSRWRWRPWRPIETAISPGPC